MTPLPLELITLLGSSLVGCVMRIWGASLHARRQEHLLTLLALQTKATITHEARTYENPGFQWTRRVIALLSVLFIIVFPKIVPVFIPDLPITIGYSEASKSLLSGTIEKTLWVQKSGIVITPLDTHLLAAIIGLYFGGAIIGNK